MTGLGDNLVNLESRQLAALTGLGSLRYFNLYLISIDKILGRYAKTSGCHLFDSRTCRCAVLS